MGKWMRCHDSVETFGDGPGKSKVHSSFFLSLKPLNKHLETIFAENLLPGDRPPWPTVLMTFPNWRTIMEYPQQHNYRCSHLNTFTNCSIISWTRVGSWNNTRQPIDYIPLADILPVRRMPSLSYCCEWYYIIWSNISWSSPSLCSLHLFHARLRV